MDMPADLPTAIPPSDELSELRSEVSRLRALVGPSEKSYEDLTRDALTARDAARNAELETGRLRAQIVELENEVRRWQRDFVWFRDRVVRKIPALGRVFARLRRQ
jgi:archaellum component FlaC